MTPLERKELDALMRIFRREMNDKKESESTRLRARACLGVLAMFRDRCAVLAATRRKFKLVAGGRL